MQWTASNLMKTLLVNWLRVRFRHSLVFWKSLPNNGLLDIVLFSWWGWGDGAIGLDWGVFFLLEPDFFKWSNCFDCISFNILIQCITWFSDSKFTEVFKRCLKKKRLTLRKRDRSMIAEVSVTYFFCGLPYVGGMWLHSPVCCIVTVVEGPPHQVVKLRTSTPLFK